MKRCAKCKSDKAADEFYAYRRNKSGLSSYCRSCTRKCALDAKNAAVNSLKNKPCMDCGGMFPPYVMDFDHRDSFAKKFDISSWTSKTRLEVLLAEVDKCDLVCANCHRIRTHNRGYKSKRKYK